VVKGHKGFTLTPEEAADGISAEEFMRGLVVDEDAGTFEWRESLPVRKTCTFPTPTPISFISSRSRGRKSRSQILRWLSHKQRKPRRMLRQRSVFIEYKDPPPSPLLLSRPPKFKRAFHFSR
jgi:hypothetical protein